MRKMAKMTSSHHRAIELANQGLLMVSRSTGCATGMTEPREYFNDEVIAQLVSNGYFKRVYKDIYHDKAVTDGLS